MTDNEIIKAFECCDIKGVCNNCPFKNDRESCERLGDLVLDLINRQKAENSNLTSRLTSLQNDLTSAKAEIERLTAMVEAAEDYLHPLPFKNAFDEEIAKAKAEAIKEFAERLKGMHRHNTTSVVSLVTVFDNINNLVDEMERREGEGK